MLPGKICIRPTNVIQVSYIEIGHIREHFLHMEQRTQFIFEIDTTDEIHTPHNILEDLIPDAHEEKELKVRLDKWLWAARFFKTRALARSAIENGKVVYEGQKTIPSKEIILGATLIINQGKHKKTVLIKQLSTRRRSTEEANALFEEIAVQTNQEAIVMTHTSPEKRPRKIARFLRRNQVAGDADSSYD